MASTEQRRLAAIMFTDMVGYSALAQRNEALALELIEEHHRLLRGILPQYQGQEIKSTGDGLLIEFASALAAVQCAVEIQRAMARRNQAESSERQVHMRIGIHLGDVVWRDGDVYGDGVNIAARIEPLAKPDGICVTRAVWEQVQNKVGHALIPFGATELKNIELPVEIFHVVMPWETAPSTPLRREQRTPGRSVLIAAAAGAVAVLAIGSWILFHGGNSTPSRTLLPRTNAPAAVVPAVAADQKSVAVLPFANMSSDKENEYLSDGITEDILHALAKVPELHVPARTSAFVFKGRNEDVRKIGELLHVGAVLEGSVQRSGERLRVTVQLINVADGYHLWSEQFDREMKDVFAIQDEIARTIVSKLQITLAGSPTPLPAKPTVKNIEAYQLYLKGRFLSQRYTAENIQQAIACFEQAVEKQPDYAQAYIALAYAYGQLQFFGRTLSSDIPEKMTTAMKKAHQLDSALPETYLFDAHGYFFYKWDWAEAERLFKRAIELDATNPDAHIGYAMFLSAMGRSQEAMNEYAVAEKLDPLSVNVKLSQGWAYYRARAFDRAVDIARKLSVTETNYHKVHELMGVALFEQGRRDEGLAEMETAVRLEGEPLEIAWLGRMYGQAGRKADAQKVLAQLQSLAKRAYVPSRCLALVYEGLGDFEQANTWMNKAIAAHEFALVFLNTEADETSRANPHYSEWLKKIGLEK